MRQEQVVVVGAGSGAITSSMIRKVRGSLMHKTETRFLIIGILSLLLHGGLIYYLASIRLKPVESAVIEEIPERFAKLIIDKPLPRETKKQQKLETDTKATQ
ncbi:MAG: hypothetical protein GF398_07195, partial [Chitinivibrionales bacterium]|nr:hypothetical protein [Chitinivibrionales bacterium]